MCTLNSSAAMRSSDYKLVLLISAIALSFASVDVQGQISRSQIISNATPYTTFSWTASSCNLNPTWNGTFCGGRNVYSADVPWVSIGTNTSMPYMWGGWSTIAQHISAMANCKSAGDICSTSGGGCSGNTSGLNQQCASGHDCSGLVSRAWALSSKAGTTTLPGISTSIASSQMQQGDIFNKVNDHTRLVTSINSNGSFTVIEASGTDWKTSFRTYTSVQLSAYTPLCYDDVIGGCGGGGGGPSCNNDTPCNSTTLPINSTCLSIGCSTIGATGPDVGSLTCNGTLYNLSRADDDVWFNITASTSSPVSLTVTPTSGNLDPVVTVYSGSCSSPVPVANGCADDYGNNVPESLTFTPIAGMTYRVQVYGYDIGVESGNFQICAVSSGSGTCPDPTISSLTFDPPNPIAGQPVDIDLVVTNVGTASTVASEDPHIEYWVDGVYTGFYDDETTVLGPGDSSTEYLNDYIFVTPGTYSVCAILEPYTNECPTNNNTTCQQITVLPGTINCSTPQLTPSSETHSPLAFSTTPGSDDVIVDAQDFCEFTISGSCLSAGWFTLDGPTSGTANSNGQFFVNYSLDNNTSTAPRTCSLNISGSTFTVTQSGCISEFDTPTSSTVPANGGSGSFDVDSYAPCSWSLTYSCPWVSLSSSGGNGDGTINYTAQSNPSQSPRNCVITLTGGDTYTITQPGCTPPTVSPGSYGPLCSDDSPLALVGNPSGGLWSGVGVFGNQFNPSVGTQVLTYTVTVNGCTNSAQTTIVVNSPPVVNAGNYGPVCGNDSPITLAGTPLGGTWSGNGVNGNVFDPSAGTQTLTYTVTQNGCTAQDQTTVVVNAPTAWYADQDGDGQGDAVMITFSCDQPPGYVSNNTDLCPVLPFLGPGDACDDGSACTINDAVNTSCNCVGTPVNSDDGDPCTLDTCDPVTGISNVFQDSDGDGTCDFFDLCSGGPEPGTPCDDGNAATQGDQIQGDCSCQGVLSCIPGTPCDDGNACTTGELFDANCNCGGGTPVNPDDSDPCTLDSCDPLTGISNVFQDSDGDGTCDANDLCPGGPEPGTPCDDGSVCTTNDVIDANCNCTGTEVNPDDGDPCTVDSCDPLTGVSNLFQDSDGDGTCDANDLCPGGPEPGTACDDNSLCTINDVVDSNCNCVGTPVDPDDNNACTSDSCDPLLGVINTTIDPDDGDPCTLDSCDPQLGVSNVPHSDSVTVQIEPQTTMYVGQVATLTFNAPPGFSIATVNWPTIIGWTTTAINDSTFEVIPGSPHINDTTVCIGVTLNGCAGSYPCVDFDLAVSVGVGQQPSSLTLLHVYPNPSTGEFVLSAASSISGPLEVQVMDATGRLVTPKLILQGRSPAIVDLEDESSGTYYLRAVHQDGVQVLRLVLQR